MTKNNDTFEFFGTAFFYGRGQEHPSHHVSFQRWVAEGSFTEHIKHTRTHIQNQNHSIIYEYVDEDREKATFIYHGVMNQQYSITTVHILNQKELKPKTTEGQPNH